MFFYPEFDNSNKKTLCEMQGVNSDMLMNIYIKRLSAGESIELYDTKCETAVMLVEGEVTFFWNGRSETGKRLNPFEKKPYALHVPKNTAVRVTATAESEIVIEQTENETEFDPVFYAPEDILYQEFGKGQWGGAGHRIVSTVFDYDNAP
jgi:5-deoxy-glucuronate isomerase